MRLLLVNDRVRPHGGSEHTVRAQIAGLLRRGHALAVMAPPEEAEAGRADPQLAGAEWLPVQHGAGFRTALRAAAEIEAQARAFGADLIEVVNIGGLLGPRGTLRLARRWALVHACRDVRPTCPRGDRALPRGGLCADRCGFVCLRRRCLGPEHEPRGLRAVVDGRLRWRALGAARAIVVESTSMAQLLAATGVPPPRLTVAPVPVHAPAAARTADATPPVILGVGLLGDPRKGLVHLARAFARLSAPGARLRLTGRPGAAWEQARPWLKTAAGRVEVLGWLGETELQAERGEARVAAFPSRFFESFGLAGAECAAAGRPVVAVDCGGPREWIRDGHTGRIVDREDPQAMAAALERYLAEPQLAADHGRAARQLVAQRFTERAFLDALEQVYAEAARAA